MNTIRTCARAAVILFLVGCAGAAAAYADALRVITTYHETRHNCVEDGFWAVRIRFNRAVAPADLAESLTVTMDGDEASFRINDPKADDTLASRAQRELRIVPEKGQAKAGLVKIVVKPGLQDASGKQALEKEYAYQFRCAAQQIYVTNFSTYYTSPKDRGVTLVFSDEVDAEDVKKLIKIIPAVKNMTVTSLEFSRRYRITGDFDLQREYVLEIPESKVHNGRAILSAARYPFKGPGVAPRIALKTGRSVVELKSRQLVPVSIENVTAMRVEVERVPAFLVPEAAAKFKEKDGLRLWPKEKRADAVHALVTAGKVPASFGGSVSRDADVFLAPEARDRVLGYSFPLSFRKKPDVGGAWIVALTDPDRPDVQDSRLVHITDLAVSYKLSARTLLIWVTSIHSGEAVPGADVLLATDGAERFLAGKTDASGIVVVKDGAELPAIEAGREEFGPVKRTVSIRALKWAVAATATDACAQRLNRDRLKPFAVKQTASVDAAPAAAKGSIFTERGIYRPGETVFFKCTVRDYKDDRIVASAGRRVTLTITDPRKEIHYTKELTLSEFGTCHDSFETKSYSPSGTYTLVAEIAKSGNEKTTFATTFLVQEYKRPRHYLTVSAKQVSRMSQEYVGLKKRVEFLEVEAKAQYYTGGPLKHARARWKATLVPVDQHVAGLEGFFFGNADEEQRFLESGESLVDKTGTLRIAIPLDPRLLTGLYGVEISVTALDVDGEPATGTTTFSPQPRYRVGIARHPARVQNGYSTILKLVVVDSEGQSVQTGQITASQLRKSSFYTQKRDENGNINYLWEYGWLTSTSSKVLLSEGQGQYEVELNEYGAYLLSFTFEDKTGAYSSQTIFKVGWDEYDDWIRGKEEKEVRTFNEVMPALSRKEYRIGETVTVEFNTRRPVKKGLIAVEAGDVLNYRVVDVNGKRVTHRFKAAANHRPNVYVSLLAAAGRTDFPVYQSQTDTDIPTVFFGYADVKIRTDVKALSVEIAPRVKELKGKPGEKTAIAFKVVDDKGKGVASEMAVCVVDEAVLALTNYKTPDLSSLTDFQKLLGVFSGDLRLSLMSQDLFRILSTRPLKGGDAAAGLVAPSVRKDFRPVAYYNPALLTDASGDAHIEFQLPDSTTAYRVYAVACDKTEGFASAERKMVVTKEFFIEPSLTRFLIPGDRVTFPVVLNNKTAESGEASVDAEPSAGLRLELPQTTAKLEPYSSSVLRPSMLVSTGIDRGMLLFRGSLKTASESFADAIETTLPVHSRFLPVNRVVMGSFSRHADISVTLPEALKKLKADEIHPGEFKAYLSLSTANWNRIAPGLKYLLQYPFGCVEQTASGIIPLAGLRSLVQQGALPGITTERIDGFLKTGVTRLLSMQLTDGAFSYWPGRTEGSWWGTQYAIFALIQAREAGFPVPEERLKSALGYVQKTLGRDPAGVFKDQPWAKYLAVFNLSEGGVLTAAELQPFLETYDSLDDQAKAFLLLAATKTGALPRKEIGDRIGKLGQALDPKQNEYYNSSFRTAAVCLMAAVQANAAPERAAYWAGYLLKNLRPEGRWYSTADTGWCLLALARYLQGKEPPAGQTIPCRIHFGAHKPLELAVSGASTDVEIDPYKLLSAGKVTIEAAVQGLVNYTLSVVHPDTEKEPAKLSKGFALRKTVENLNGKDEIRIGDIVRITLEIQIDPSIRSQRGYWEYVALEDPVPAGLVPISSELATEGVVRENDQAGERSRWRDGYYDMEPTYREFRDDGVRVFKDRAWPGQYRFTYLARAAAQGDFWMRGSRVSLMYNPDYYGKTVGRRVQVLPAE